MAKSYLLNRCGNEGLRQPVMFFTADSEQEAREAPTWLRRQHPDYEPLRLGPGEFFEIIEQGMCPPGDWEAAAAALEAGAAPKPGDR